MREVPGSSPGNRLFFCFLEVQEPSSRWLRSSGGLGLFERRRQRKRGVKDDDIPNRTFCKPGRTNLRASGTKVERCRTNEFAKRNRSNISTEQLTAAGPYGICSLLLLTRRIDGGRSPRMCPLLWCLHASSVSLCVSGPAMVSYWPMPWIDERCFSNSERLIPGCLVSERQERSPIPHDRRETPIKSRRSVSVL